MWINVVKTLPFPLDGTAASVKTLHVGIIFVK
jgi:hypothetical protein